MDIQPHSVPFRITDITLGFQEAEGWMRFDGARLVLEYHIRDALGISVKTGDRVLNIGLDRLVSLEIQDWWLALRLELAVRPKKLIDELPNAESGRVRLKIQTKYREQLRQLVYDARQAISARRFNRVTSPQQE